MYFLQFEKRFPQVLAYDPQSWYGRHTGARHVAWYSVAEIVAFRVITVGNARLLHAVRKPQAPLRAETDCHNRPQKNPAFSVVAGPCVPHSIELSDCEHAHNG